MTLSRWLALAAVIVAIDQATKYAVVEYFSDNPPIVVAPFLNFLLVYNPGAAFSFLSDAAGWQRLLFIAIAILASAWIIWLLRRHHDETRFALALTLVLGGAIGNAIDRLWIGMVVDFIDFHAWGWHWPAFNVADSAITCGALLLVWDAFRPARRGAAGKTMDAPG